MRLYESSFEDREDCDLEDRGTSRIANLIEIVVILDGMIQYIGFSLDRENMFSTTRMTSIVGSIPR